MDSGIIKGVEDNCSIPRLEILDLFNYGTVSAEPLEFEEEQLHRLVFLHLKELGIVGESDIPFSRVFYDEADLAVSEEEIMEPVEMIIDHSFVSLVVPKILKETCEFIDGSLGTEGIFRKSGAMTRIKELKVRIQSETGTFNGDDSVFDACSLLKLYLRELKRPLIPVPAQKLLAKCIQCPDERVAIEALLSVLFLLPRTNAQLLIYLLSFLHKVGEQSASNKMDVKNLSLIFTPNFMHGPWIVHKKRSKSKNTGRHVCRKNTEHMEPYRIAVERLIAYGDFAGWIPRGLQRYLNTANPPNTIQVTTPKTTGGRTPFRPGSLHRVIRWVQRISTPKSASVTSVDSARQNLTPTTVVGANSCYRALHSNSNKRLRREPDTSRKRCLLSRKNNPSKYPSATLDS